MPYYLSRLKSPALPDHTLCELDALLRQLDPELPELTRVRLNKTMAGGRILVVRHGKPEGGHCPIVAMATLVYKEQLAGCFGVIEDVVVDQEHRRHGLGQWLTLAIISHAYAIGISHIDLTSRPERAAANSMYVKMGFVKRDTNVYRLLIDE